MPFNRARDISHIPESSRKRLKTTSGYFPSPNDTPAYNSENDDVDELVAGYIPGTPKKAPGIFETQDTQILVKATPPGAFQTQPTQIVQPKTTPLPGGFETQATQIIDRNAPQSSPSCAAFQPAIQVPASSPFPVCDTTPRKPVQHMAPASPRTLANLMAPAGTSFKPPAGIVKKQEGTVAKPFTIDLMDSDSDDGPRVAGDETDSEDERMKRANIKPSTFAPRTSFGSSTSRFGETVKGFVDQPPPKGVARLGQLQMRPDRARPIQDINMDDLEMKTRENITRIRSVFPGTSILAAKNALLAKHGNFQDAMELLASQEQQDVIAISDDELACEPKREEPQMKRGLDLPTKSIRAKYSSTQALPKQPPLNTPAKPKRKLVKGRRNPDPSSTALSSPLKQEAGRSGSPAISIAESYETDDSGIASEEEEDPELDDRLLKFLNKCTLQELIDLTSITKDNANLMISARPFRSLDAARCVQSAPLKSGKKSSKAPVGEKIVDTAHQMFSGYEAIDVLVAKCKELGKPLTEEMATWGFNVFGQKNGELEMTSLEDDAESMRDSGIGSPTSGTASPNVNGEDEIRTAASQRKRTNVKFLKKPEFMAEDCVLKDYQVVGLNWLALMFRNKTSGILADEMGLGKTCQVIAFISHLVECGQNGPHLVVCPGSTLENWLRECRRFAPQLVVEPYHGAQKDRAEMADAILSNKGSINIVVTTYDMAAKKEDNKFLRRLGPNVCVYDEGHYLKNVNSQRYQGLIKIPANFRLLLTGTPLQNNLQELAALLAFIMPEVFKERSEDLAYIFKAKATTRDNDHAALLSAQRIARARSMLTPFVLRRKKTQVLKHLPTKVCRVEYATMHPAQLEIYNGHLDQARERARLRVEGAKIPKNINDENNPLMQLRKAAIHPMLFRRHFTDDKVEKMADILRRKLPEHFPSDKNHKREHLIGEMRSGSDFWLHSWCYDYHCLSSFDVPDMSWMNSGKVQSMIKLVKQYKENGDRVLIFSQFALVLDILEAVLNTNTIQFTRIDGSTKIDDRQSLIDNFRDDESITAFLLTTKAGGTGINLMYANKVIIFDGSFNPQDDRQAENRAHRVGQTRDVEVVRLVTKDTVEEQIYALGQSKLVLDGRVAGDDEAAMDAAGEKAVSKMLLEGTTVPNEEIKDEGKGEVKGGKDGMLEDGPPLTLQKKKSSLLGSMLIKRESATEEK